MFSLSNPIVRLIYNPASGTHSVEFLLPEIIRVLNEFGWQVDISRSERRGDITRLAQDAIQADCQVVIVAGGDGSLNEAANALAHSPVALGVIPTGTANVWARQIGVPVPAPGSPHKLVEAARSLATGQIVEVDLGLVNGRYFLMWAGAGLDAEVAASIEPKPPYIRRFGMLGYAAFVISVALHYRGVNIAIQADDQIIRTRAILTVVSNIPLYGAILHVAPKAILNDGYLDLAIFRGESLFLAIYHALTLLTNSVEYNPRATLLRVKKVQIDASRPCHVHVDAEPYTHTPASIEVSPGSLRVLVPRGAPKTLFQ